MHFDMLQTTELKYALAKTIMAYPNDPYKEFMGDFFDALAYAKELEREAEKELELINRLKWQCQDYPFLFLDGKFFTGIRIFYSDYPGTLVPEKSVLFSFRPVALSFDDYLKTYEIVNGRKPLDGYTRYFSIPTGIADPKHLSPTSGNIVSSEEFSFCLKNVYAKNSYSWFENPFDNEVFAFGEYRLNDLKH